ncbi:hypothetical protein Droror1_Dr00018081 [Drosera rotundifolia]
MKSKAEIAEGFVESPLIQHHSQRKKNKAHNHVATMFHHDPGHFEAWERIPMVRPREIADSPSLAVTFHLAYKWFDITGKHLNPKRSSTVGHFHSLSDQYPTIEFIWEPYTEEILEDMPEDFVDKRERAIWFSHVPLIHFAIVEYYVSFRTAR